MEGPPIDRLGNFHGRNNTVLSTILNTLALEIRTVEDGRSFCQLKRSPCDGDAVKYLKKIHKETPFVYCMVRAASQRNKLRAVIGIEECVSRKSGGRRVRLKELVA